MVAAAGTTLADDASKEKEEHDAGPAPKCPNCQGTTEPGWLGVDSFIGGTTWFKVRNFWGTGGEPLKRPDLSGMIYHLAHRCTKCRLVIMRY